MNRSLFVGLALSLGSCSLPSNSSRQLLFEPDGGPLNADTGSNCEQLSDAYCTGDRAHYCRLNAISAEFIAPCVADSECILAEPIFETTNCLSYGVCEQELPAILASAVSQRKAALLSEMQRYCSNSPCNSASSCADSSAAAVARCISGACQRASP